jgi:AraC family transcriptional regulator
MEDTMLTTTSFQATVRDIPAIRVAALPHRGDYINIGSTFERLSALAAAQGLFGPHTRSFGIYYDDPSATPRESLRSDACITLPDRGVPGGDLELREIRGGRYAVSSRSRIDGSTEPGSPGAVRRPPTLPPSRST